MPYSTGKTLLVIDDDPLFCDSIREHFRGTLEVLIAQNGEEGIRICSNTKVDVVLLDQKLPDAEGHMLCSTILKYNIMTRRRSFSSPPIRVLRAR